MTNFPDFLTSALIYATTRGDPSVEEHAYATGLHRAAIHRWSQGVEDSDEARALYKLARANGWTPLKSEGGAL